MKCMLCRLKNGEIKNERVYEDELVYAYKDWNPWAEIHVLVFPKEHIGLKNKADIHFEQVTAQLEASLSAVAKAAGMKKVLKVVRIDNEEHVPQNLEHLHYHILGSSDENPPDIEIL